VSTQTGEHKVTDGEFVFEMWQNSRYTVMKRDVDHAKPPMVHLSIRRNDRRPVANWRDMQAIKNELVGAECEGVQIFPAESRLVDNANQYHMYVCSDSSFRLPFGYHERVVTEGNYRGAVQEPFEEHVQPPDLIPREKIEARYDEYAKRFSSAVPGITIPGE
jgi:hypothetical protein